MQEQDFEEASRLKDEQYKLENELSNMLQKKRLQKDYKIRTGKKRHTIFVQENTRNVNI